VDERELLKKTITRRARSIHALVVPCCINQMLSCACGARVTFLLRGQEKGSPLGAQEPRVERRPILARTRYATAARWRKRKRRVQQIQLRAGFPGATDVSVRPRAVGRDFCKATEWPPLEACPVGAGGSARGRLIPASAGSVSTADG